VLGEVRRVEEERKVHEARRWTGFLELVQLQPKVAVHDGGDAVAQDQVSQAPRPLHVLDLEHTWARVVPHTTQ